jgi:hypothetical protein
MISFREGDNKFASPLIAGINADASVLHSLWVHQRNELEQKIWLRFKQVRCLAFDRGLEFLGVFARDTVPGLCLSPMHYRNTVDSF